MNQIKIKAKNLNTELFFQKKSPYYRGLFFLNDYEVVAHFNSTIFVTINT